VCKQQNLVRNVGKQPSSTFQADEKKRDIGLAIVLMFTVLFSVEAKPAAAWRAYNDVPASDLPAQPCNPANSIPCGGVVPAEQPVMFA
jgi:hypothetical protein